MRSTLTIHELEVFLEIADARSFRVAAERSLISQPAVSRTLKSAEWKLKVRLFDRNTSKVELTGAGKELLPIARRIVSEFRGSLSDLSEFVAGRSGSVVVTSIPSAAAAVLPWALSNLQHSHPRVKVAIHPSPSDLVEAMISDGSADFGLSSPPQKKSGFAYEALLQDEFVLVCSNSDELATLRTATWSVFTGRPFVASGPGTSIRHITDHVLEQTGQLIEPRYESSHLGVLGAMITAGLGITAIPRLALRLLDVSALTVVPLTGPRMHREIGFLTKQGRSLSAAAVMLIETLRHFKRVV